MDKPNQWLDDTAWDNITELDKYVTIPYTYIFLAPPFSSFTSFLSFHLNLQFYVYVCIYFSFLFFLMFLMHSHFFFFHLSSFHPNCIPFPPGWPALWALPTHLISTPGTGISGSPPPNLRTPHSQVLFSVSVSLRTVISWIFVQGVCAKFVGCSSSSSFN